jgi:hypothetical protein
MTHGVPRTDELFSAFRDLAAGRGVRRGRHDLRVEGRDRSALFEEALKLEGFEPVRVRDARVEMGEKVPAFLVNEGSADFGWVFWEKFSEGRARKLFGSTVRNAKGDWEIQLGEGSPRLVHVCLAAKAAVDPEHPSSLG